MSSSGGGSQLLLVFIAIAAFVLGGYELHAILRNRHLDSWPFVRSSSRVLRWAHALFTVALGCVAGAFVLWGLA